MARGVWSETEPAVEIDSLHDLDRFVERAEATCERPTAISVDVHGYRVDLLVGHDRSFVHMTPESHEKPYFVTVGAEVGDGVNFWLHSWHHTWFESRHLVTKATAREALREFFRTGKLSTALKWEQYEA